MTFAQELRQAADHVNDNTPRGQSLAAWLHVTADSMDTFGHFNAQALAFAREVNGGAGVEAGSDDD